MKRHENPGEKPLLAKLDALRAVRGMTQDALERAAALPANKIAKWRSGTGEPKLREGLRLARALGVPIEFLADDDQCEPVPGPDEDEVFLVKTIRALRIDRDEAFKRLLVGGFGGLEIGAGAALPLHPAPAPTLTAPPAVEPLGTGRVIGEREHPRREPGGSPVDVEGQDEGPEAPARPRRPRR